MSDGKIEMGRPRVLVDFAIVLACVLWIVWVGRGWRKPIGK